MAVSYTHLDVYKRQVMTNNNNGKIVEVVELENKILNSDDNYESIVAVSYTHLYSKTER